MIAIQKLYAYTGDKDRGAMLLRLLGSGFFTKEGVRLVYTCAEYPRNARGDSASLSFLAFSDDGTSSAKGGRLNCYALEERSVDGRYALFVTLIHDLPEGHPLRTKLQQLFSFGVGYERPHQESLFRSGQVDWEFVTWWDDLYSLSELGNSLFLPGAR